MVEPIFGDVAINQRIAGDVRESKIKEKPQGQPASVTSRKYFATPGARARTAWSVLPSALSSVLKHVANIAAWR